MQSLKCCFRNYANVENVHNVLNELKKLVAKCYSDPIFVK